MASDTIAVRLPFDQVLGTKVGERLDAIFADAINSDHAVFPIADRNRAFPCSFTAVNLTPEFR